MKELPLEIKIPSLGIAHQVCRTKTKAIYKIDDKNYEVFQIQFQLPCVVKRGDREIIFIEKELYPSTNKWGKIAWSYTSLNDALVRYNSLI